MMVMELFGNVNYQQQLQLVMIELRMDQKPVRIVVEVVGHVLGHVLGHLHMVLVMIVPKSHSPLVVIFEIRLLYMETEAIVVDLCEFL